MRIETVTVLCIKMVMPNSVRISVCKRGYDEEYMRRLVADIIENDDKSCGLIDTVEVYKERGIFIQTQSQLVEAKRILQAPDVDIQYFFEDNDFVKATKSGAVLQMVALPAGHAENKNRFENGFHMTNNFVAKREPGR